LEACKADVLGIDAMELALYINGDISLLRAREVTCTTVGGGVQTDNAADDSHTYSSSYSCPCQSVRIPNCFTFV